VWKTLKVVYVITPELRERFKEPFGFLILGSVDETMSKLNELVHDENPPKIVSVGDVVSGNLHNFGFHPQLSIVDNKSLREATVTGNNAVERTLRVCNPQGTITEEAIIAIRDCLGKGEHAHIIVDGEEDLLALIAVLYSPENAFVVYGQPYLGIVVVRATSDKKAKARKFLKAMEPRKAK
jgi:uncharacterized protein (UPF0218 family)